MLIRDLAVMRYRDAWAIQEEANAQVLAGAEERIFLVEHPPVITFGRRPGVSRNLLVSDEQLAKLGVELVQSNRGGDITFHGPGQIVAYPIVRLGDHRLSVGGYVRCLLEAVIAALADFGIEGRRDEGAVGVWVPGENGELAKICAVGVRIRRGVSLHGLALNVTTDLRLFELIVPCGLAGRAVTSMRKMLRETCPGMDQVKATLGRRLAEKLGV
jgi:lipoyl(octanoyl) transferase